MKHRLPVMNPSARRGFTLVEVLAAIVPSVTRKFQESAHACNRLSNMRQAGSLLLGLAGENNGRCSYFSGGGSTAWEYRHYIMIRKGKDLPDNDDSYVNILHWDFRKLPPLLSHWNCRAINFQNVTYPDGTSTKWTQEKYTNLTMAGRRT